MLGTILDSVRSALPALRANRDDLHRAAHAADPARDFAGALVEHGLGVIAEIKRRSPSRGVIDPDLDPVALAQTYQSGGAAAISVLTEPAFFDGSLDDLESVRRAVSVPVLRKDFIVDEVQVWQARAAGADSILLIVAALRPLELKGLLEAARSVGMEPLVEIHTASEAESAIEAGARVIGVNNRDLATFDVNLATAAELRPLLRDATTVAESGIWTLEDAKLMRSAGFDAVLVGESLVRADDPAKTIEDWTRGA